MLELIRKTMSETDDKDDFLREIDELLGEDEDIKLPVGAKNLDSDPTFGLDDLDVNLDDPPPGPQLSHSPSKEESSPLPRTPSPARTKYVLAKNSL